MISPCKVNLFYKTSQRFSTKKHNTGILFFWGCTLFFEVLYFFFGYQMRFPSIKHTHTHTHTISKKKRYMAKLFLSIILRLSSWKSGCSRRRSLRISRLFIFSFQYLTPNKTGLKSFKQQFPHFFDFQSITTCALFFFFLQKQKHKKIVLYVSKKLKNFVSLNIEQKIQFL